MAVRRILLPWDRQPQGVVRLNQENKFARGIVAAVYPGGGIYTVASGITLGAGVRGQHWTLTGGTAQAIDVPSVGYAVGTVAFSGIAIARSRGTGTQAVININYNGSTVPFIIHIGGGGVVSGAGYFDGGWIMSGATTDVRNDGLWHVIGGAARHGSQRYFIDGRLNASTAQNGTSASVNTNPISFGCYKNNNDSLNGDLAMGVVWANRFLSDDEFAELYENPNQIWEPISIWVPVSAGGGAATDLTIQEAAHAHGADNLSLTVATGLTVADAAHAHTADNLTLSTSSAVDLTIADATHAHAADAPTLTLGYVGLLIADALHGHTADGLTLEVSGTANLVIQDAAHGHAADAPTVSLGYIDLAVLDGMHAHTSDGLTLSVVEYTALVIARAIHGHLADNVTLSDSAAQVLGSLAGSRPLDPATRSNRQTATRSNRQTATR